MDEIEQAAPVRLARTILASQFIPPEPQASLFFDPPIGRPDPNAFEAFHFPERMSMYEMLDKPLPELPFAFEPGLIQFSYEPGFRGEMQRFWDVITPEFGFKTKNGTKVECVLLLVIVGCGW